METRRRIFLVMGLLCLILTSCSREVNENKTSQTNVIINQDTTVQLSSMEEINDYLATKPATFIVDMKKDTLLTCKNGTILYFPSNLFEFEDGSKLTGNVEISIKEYTTLGDFIKNNLTTMSGDRILETGGMVYVSASSKGRRLRLKKGKEYELYFPKKIERDDMKLFYGKQTSNGQVDWKLASNQTSGRELSEEEEDSLRGLAYDYYYRLTDKTWETNDRHVKWILRNGKQNVFDYFDSSFTVPKRIEEKFYTQEYPTIEFSFKLNPFGKLIEIEFEKNSDLAFSKIVSRFFHTMPIFDISSMGKQSAGKKYWLNIRGIKSFNQARYRALFRNQYARLREKAIAQMDDAEVDYYVLVATKLEWINCDRFWNTPDEKADFYVTTKHIENARTYLVFKNSNSILKGENENNQIVFKSIPTNQPAKVICISSYKGNAIISVQQVSTFKGGIALDKFKNASLAQLDYELDELVQ